jgi:hypothetical protein
MIDLLKPSKEKLLVLAENDRKIAKRKKKFYQAFSIIFMQNKRQFFGLFREFKEANYVLLGCFLFAVLKQKLKAFN